MEHNCAHVKLLIENFISISVGVKEKREDRLERIPKLNVHGILQMSYFVGHIADFIDSFEGDATGLRQELLNQSVYFMITCAFGRIQKPIRKSRKFNRR